jgi:hypothetical protein
VTDLRQSGLTLDEVENALVQDLELIVSAGASIPRTGTGVGTRALERTISVGGRSITYRVVEQPDGTLSIGTYFLS